MAMTLLTDCGPAGDSGPVGGDQAAAEQEARDPFGDVETVDGQIIAEGPISWRGLRTVELQAFGQRDQWKASTGGVYVVFEYLVLNRSSQQVDLARVAPPVLWEAPGQIYRADPALTAAVRAEYPEFAPLPALLGPGMTVTNVAVFEVPDHFTRKWWRWSPDGETFAEVPAAMTRNEAIEVGKEADRRRAQGAPQNNFRAPGPDDRPEDCGSAGCPNY